MSIPPSCKRLAEVDFPIAVVSKHAAREKSIRHGHPSTLHLWWARRPLASSRAMLLALLLPDPVDADCPEEFKTQARKLLPKVQGNPGPDDMDLRQGLLKFIGDFANWDLSSNPAYLEVSRGLVKAAHGEEPPLVVDPFAGGGSIPLEALRLGCDAFASDLNPVAALILKVMLEDIPRHGPGLADELRKVGKQIKEAAQQELGEYYPLDPDGARPIAYLWARTVCCEAVGCGAEIPLMRSFWLAKKANRKRALRYQVLKEGNKPSFVEFEIFEPKQEFDVPLGTVTRAKARCLCCNSVLLPDRVRAQLREQRGGADVIFDRYGKRVGGARMLAVVTLKPGQQGRHYRLPHERDYQAIRQAMEKLKEVAAQPLPNGLSPVPDEPTPAGGGSGAGRAFSVQNYGMMTFGDLFTARQKLALVRLAIILLDGRNERLLVPLSLTLSRGSNAWAALCRWDISRESHQGVYSRQTLSMVWDFSEAVPLSTATGGFDNILKWITDVLEKWPGSLAGQVQVADAIGSPLPDSTVSIWFTDPPYYDAIPYSDLSDFFFVWLKRIMPNHPLLRDPFDIHNPLTPKIQEAVQDEIKEVNGRPKDRYFFEETMAQAFAEGRRVLADDGIGSVVFAHKTTEGWEALLSGMIQGGWTITGSWPIATEMGSRLRARDSAALATSVHLVCRPRTTNEIGDWDKVLRELPDRVGDWMERLMDEGVRGADLVFACIGPALEIYSRYARVETAAGDEVPLAQYLEKVWEVVGRTALEQVLGTAEARARNGAAGAVEEDARLTALFLWTLQSTEAQANGNGPRTTTDDDVGASAPKGFSLIHDVVRRFAQPLGIHLPIWENRIIKTTKGVVRLIPVAQRAGQLFGEEGTHAIAEELERDPAKAAQVTLFPDMQTNTAPKIRGRRRAGTLGDSELTAGIEATTLDRVHAAMLLQKSGRTNALRAMIKAEQDRGSDFLRLANALSALYPKGSEEKRLLEAMLMAAGR